MKKLLGLLLALCLLVSALAGCGSNKEEKSTTPRETKPIGEIDPDNPYNKYLSYTLTDEDVELFNAALLTVEQLYLEDASIEEIDEAEDTLENLGEYIADQSSIANVIYCCDTTDEEASERYLKSQELGNQMADDYMLCARRIYESDAPNKDYFFEDWTEAEMEQLEHYTSRVAELSQRNAELLVAYRDLKDPSTSSKLLKIYRELVLNNNELASIYGYDNYYEYAYAVEHDRDYASGKIDTMRGYAEEYLVPACRAALKDFEEAFDSLNMIQQQKVSDLIFADYDMGINYVEKYLETLPESTQEAMNKMFNEERVIFTDNKNAREGAFTTLIGFEPFCFFGPGYKGATTIVHELGHYYAAVAGDFETTPLDLAEIHSQGNEWIFTAFLEGELKAPVYDAFKSYCLYEAIACVLVPLAVDAFEEAVYSHPDIENMTMDDFEAIMEQVGEEFGGMEFYENYVTDLQRYWKMVVVESPVYYASYAVSGVAALNLYCVAVDDYEEALDIYRRLAERENYDDGFLEIIEDAGLSSPFKKDAYEEIYDLVS